MFKLTTSKKEGYSMYAIPMQDEAHAGMFADNDCVYCLDGKKHGHIPAVVFPELADIWGGEQVIRKAGYRKHWLVFEDILTGEYTFGNKPSFSKSADAEDRAKAATMPIADIELLKTL